MKEKQVTINQSVAQERWKNDKIYRRKSVVELMRSGSIRPMTNNQINTIIK